MKQIQSQDVVLAIYLNFQNERSSFNNLAETLEISVSQAHSAYKRLIAVKLVDEEFGKPIVSNLHNLLSFGIPYVFPLSEGKVVTGIPTGVSHPILSDRLISHSNMGYVWESSLGSQSGISISPLHRSVIPVALQCEKSYAALAAIDSIRIGNGRERKVAREILKELMYNEKL